MHILQLLRILCVKNFSFAEDDLEENILFDEREEGKFKSSNEALIKACTIHKLIERLTFHEYGGGHSSLVSYMYMYMYVCFVIYARFKSKRHEKDNTTQHKCMQTSRQSSSLKT